MNLRASNVGRSVQEQEKETQMDRDICHHSQGHSMLLDSPKGETVPLPLILPTAAPEESTWGTVTHRHSGEKPLKFISRDDLALGD